MSRAETYNSVLRHGTKTTFLLENSMYLPKVILACPEIFFSTCQQ